MNLEGFFNNLGPTPEEREALAATARAAGKKVVEDIERALLIGLNGYEAWKGATTKFEDALKLSLTGQPMGYVTPKDQTPHPTCFSFSPCYANPFHQEEKTELDEAGAKACAKILLLGLARHLVVPTKEEWVGFNLLERDDQLPPRRT